MNLMLKLYLNANLSREKKVRNLTSSLLHLYITYFLRGLGFMLNTLGVLKNKNDYCKFIN